MTSPVRFSDYPSADHQKDYEPAREYLAQRASKLSGLLGLYEYGSITAPGISDIDLIAVISGKFDETEMHKFLTGTDAPPYVIRVLDQGTIKPVSATLFNRIKVLGDIRIKPVHAPEPITPSAPSESSQIFIDIANIIDWLPERVLMLRSLLKQRTLSCRRVLGGLGSFRHSVSTTNRVIGYEQEQSVEFSKAYDVLRNNWFNQTENYNFNTTLSLIEQAVGIGQELITQATQRVIQLGIFEHNQSASGSIFWLNPSTALIFNNQNYDELTLKGNQELLVQNIPPAWLSVFATYASITGDISSMISSNLEIKTGYSHHTINSEFERVLIERIEWINESFRFLNPLGLVKLMYRFSHIRPH